MKKYYYYVVKMKDAIVPVVCWSYTGFPMTDSIKIMEERFHTDVIITFWAEISKAEYNSFINTEKEETK